MYIYNIVNWQVYFFIFLEKSEVFKITAKLGWAKFRTLKRHCGGLGGLQILGVDLQILENYLQNVYFGLNSVSSHGSYLSILF